MDRQNLKVSDHQELRRRESPIQQQSSKKLHTFTAFKDEGAQLESFRLLAFQPKDIQVFGTSRDILLGLYSPPTVKYTQTQTETQPQHSTSPLHQHDTLPFPQFQIKPINDCSRTVQEEKGNPLQELKYGAKKKCHLEEKENRDNSDPGDEEGRIIPSSPKPNAKQCRVKHQHVENICETTRYVGEAPTNLAVDTSGATSVGLWKPQHPSSVCESDVAKHSSVSPPQRENAVPPRAWRSQEVIVSLETVNDHIEGESSSNTGTPSKSCDQTLTCLHLCCCSKSRAGSFTASQCVEDHKQASTTVCHGSANGTSQASTLKRSPAPLQSTTRSCDKDEDNPSPQCLRFPKLPSTPPCPGFQDSHLNQSGGDPPSDTEGGWMFLRIPKLDQDQRTGPGLCLQRQLSPSRLNREERTDYIYNGKYKTQC